MNKKEVNYKMSEEIMNVESPYLDDLIEVIAKTTSLETIQITSNGVEISVRTSDTAKGRIIKVTPAMSTINEKYASTKLLKAVARLQENKEFWHKETYVLAGPNNDSKEEPMLTKDYAEDIMGMGLYLRIYLDDYRSSLQKKLRDLFIGRNK